MDQLKKKQIKGIVDESIKDITEELLNSDFQKWISNYTSTQRLRLIQDLEFITGYIGKKNSILEVGSSPYITTLSLKRLGFSLYGIDIAPERFSDALIRVRLDKIIKKCNIETERLPAGFAIKAYPFAFKYSG